MNKNIVISNLKKIILVTGYSRSGTTLMSSIHGSSKDVFALKETHYFENLVDGSSILSVLSYETKKFLAVTFFNRAYNGILLDHDISVMDKHKIHELVQILEKNYPKDLTGAELYLCMLDVLAKYNNVSTICEQTGKNLFFFGYYCSFNVEIKISHMIRNPLNVIKSEALKYKLRFLGLKKIPFFETLRVYLSYNPILLCLVIKGFDRHFERILNEFGEGVIKKIHFESLIADSDFLTSLGKFTGIYDYDLNEVEFWGSSLVSEGKIRKKGIVKSDTNGSEKFSFRVYAGRFWVWLILKEYSLKNGYTVNAEWRWFLPGFLWLLFTPIQIFIIFGLNLKRAPNFIKALGRRLF